MDHIIHPIATVFHLSSTIHLLFPNRPLDHWTTDLLKNHKIFWALFLLDHWTIGPQISNIFKRIGPFFITRPLDHWTTEFILLLLYFIRAQQFISKCYRIFSVNFSRLGPLTPLDQFIPIQIGQFPGYELITPILLFS